MPIIKNTNQHRNDLSGSRYKWKDMLLEIGNHIINTDLTNYLQDSYD